MAVSPAPLPATLAPGHSLGVRAASTDSASASGSIRSVAAPSDLTALVCPGVSQAKAFDIDDEFVWSGTDDGVVYSTDTSKIGHKTLYSLPSCFCVCIECNEECITLPPSIHSIIKNMRRLSIGVLPTGRVVVSHSVPG